MSNDVKRAGLSSVAAKMLRAGVVAGVLVAFGSAHADASSIAITQTYSEPDNVSSHTYNFDGGSTVPGGYSFVLAFDQLTIGAEFDLTVIATTFAPEDLEPRFDNNFPNSRCVTFATGGTECVDFEIKGEMTGPDQFADFPTQDPTKWIGSFDIDISWFLDTNGDFPNGADRIRILHNRGDQEGDNFDTDITRRGSYCGFECAPPPCDPCEIDFLSAAYFGDDPAIGGRDDNFQSFTVVQVSDVPEPATMLLVGSGVLGLVRQHRRRRLASRQA